eukprot:TRINITY_DN68758_c0_g1_i1.p1 TRINITY_DN68758_c0_g1~~TRINITY_DN68758_c0_g1_i1.p1  ORF type:complete len:874 (-),score=136.00 TRINITY_DN68758_c0_g1_i1:239-2797(-)
MADTQRRVGGKRVGHVNQSKGEVEDHESDCSDFYTSVLALFRPPANPSSISFATARLSLCRKARLLLASEDCDETSQGDQKSKRRRIEGPEAALRHVLEVLSKLCDEDATEATFTFAACNDDRTVLSGRGKWMNGKTEMHGHDSHDAEKEKEDEDDPKQQKNDQPPTPFQAESRQAELVRESQSGTRCKVLIGKINCAPRVVAEDACEENMGEYEHSPTTTCVEVRDKEDSQVADTHTVLPTARKTASIPPCRSQTVQVIDDDADSTPMKTVRDALAGVADGALINKGDDSLPVPASAQIASVSEPITPGEAPVDSQVDSDMTVLDASESLISSAMVAKASQKWIISEIVSFFDDQVCDKLLSDESPASGVVASKATLELVFGNPNAIERIKAFGLTDIVDAMTSEAPQDSAVCVEFLLTRVLMKNPDRYVPTPLMSSYREASEEERNNFPHICAAFHTYLNQLPKLTVGTREAYSKALIDIFALDMKSPGEMSSVAYRETVKRTIEDMASNHVHASSLKYFAAFWQQRKKDPFVDADDAPAALVALYKTPERKQRCQASEGDFSAEARSSEDLPEGWSVHTRASTGRLIGWASPRGRFYSSKKELGLRLERIRTPLQMVIDKMTTPVKPARSTEVEGTPEPERAPKGPREPSKPLDELFSSPTDQERVTDRDRELLPRVIASFSRYLAETKGDLTRQTTRDNYLVSLFRLFSKLDRSLAALAEPRLADLVASSEESRRHHGVLACAVRSFGAFWRDNGGYDGKFEQATREHLNLALNVRPVLVDSVGSCGQNLPMGEICRRLRQKCDSCGMSLRCFKHSEHSITECREVFWATHSETGKRTRTMKDFFRTR